jgi:hypothetical protein
MVWYGMVWYGMVWYGMVWYGMVWYRDFTLILNRIYINLFSEIYTAINKDPVSSNI